MSESMEEVPMPRKPREHSESGFYHVTMRGNAKVVIFECDKHREHFLKILERYRDECKFKIIAWCLMDNHVHLVLDASDVDLSATLQRIATAYVVYFNKAEERVGHLFQSPFRSKPIEYEEQLVNTVRYVHENPERACMCGASEYRWSSYREYAEGPTLIDAAPVLGIVGSVEQLLDARSDYECVVREHAQPIRVNDSQAFALMCGTSGITKRGAMQNMPRSQRDAAILKGSRYGLPIKGAKPLFSNENL